MGVFHMALHERLGKLYFFRPKGISLVAVSHRRPYKLLQAPVVLRAVVNYRG